MSQLIDGNRQQFTIIMKFVIRRKMQISRWVLLLDFILSRSMFNISEKVFTVSHMSRSKWFVEFI